MIMCPRCDSEAVTDMAALSRLTRDDGAPVYVCQRCGSREAAYGRDVLDHPLMSRWPLPVETLLDEEHWLLTTRRGASLVNIAAGDLDTPPEQPPAAEAT